MTPTPSPLQTISVALATCNGAKYIEEQLDSLLAQTRLPDEIVVSDDGSDDGTVEIVERVAARSPVPIRVFRSKQRAGYEDNFLRSASRTTGRWIAFCDQDDVWLPHKLERCAQLFSEPGVLAVVHNANLMYDGRKTAIAAHRELTTTEIVAPLTQDPFRTYLGFCILFRRELVDFIDFERRPVNVNRPPRKLPHDDWITFLSLSLGRTALINEPLVWYRRHAEAVTPPAAPPWVRAHLAMRRYATGLSEMARAAEDRADILQRAELSIVDEQQCQRAASRYRAIGLITRRRQALSSRPGAVRRLRELVALAVDPQYLGRKALMKDLLFGALHLDRLYAQFVR